MRLRLTAFRVRAALLLLLVGLPSLCIVHARQEKDPPAPGERRPPGRSAAAWTLEEALAQLRLYPRDPYLQYIALQLARREGPDRTQEVAREVERLALIRSGRRGNERAERVDLFSIFTGALAVQESLQLDTMRGNTTGRGDPVGAVPVPAVKKIVDVDKLQGPTIKSHPWEKMLAGRKPELSPLARAVPEDFYLIEFRSLNRMLELLETGDLWSLHLFTQATNEARTHEVGDRLRAQLAIETNRLLRPLYDAVVEEVVVTGSDLFVAEGSDVTVIFKAAQPELLRARMDGFLANALKGDAEAEKVEGSYLDIPYVHVRTPDRKVHVFSAWPEANLHVRSNSKIALQRVLAAYRGKMPDGKPAARLGESAEFAYIRTLMPRGAKEEDGFVYLSDPFIRHLVGPQLKLTERRRMLCYNHLRMIGHAALLYRTEHGSFPKKLEDLSVARCCPGEFNKGDLMCFDGGKYSLSADGTEGVCSHHGRAHSLTPCCETPLVWVTGQEADEYRAFLEAYNRYWRTFFDPIGIRVKVTPKEYRLETIVLPLIDNSIYTGLAMGLNGEPEKLDALPVPKRNIFTVAGRLNKDALLKMGVADAEKAMRRDLARELEIDESLVEDLDLVALVTKGLGNQLALNIYDSVPTFDLDVVRFLGLMLGSFNVPNRIGSEELIVSFLVSALNSPVYISVPVQDEKVVDRFLAAFDRGVAAASRRQDPSLGFLRFEQDFYKAPLDEQTQMRAYGFSIGPVKWRVFWARIGKGLYIASKPFVLKDILELERARSAPDAEPQPARDDAPAHAMLRLRPGNWDQVLPDYRLAWSESARKACINNLGPLASVGRSTLGDVKERDPAALGRAALGMASDLLAVRFYCPEGGTYLLDPSGKTCACTLHGTVLEPRQTQAPTPANSTARVLGGLGEVTASLTFLEDGLHAVLTIKRR